MKLINIGVLCFFLCGGYLNAEELQKVNLPISRIYAVEKGFDDNDSVDIPVFGYLPDTCHKVEKGSAKVDRAEHKIEVNITGYVRRQEVCLEILTPFLEVVSVGTLKAGTYEIKAARNPRVNAALEVKIRSTDSRDDYIYAPVDTVELERAALGFTSSTQVVLKGTYPYMLQGCMRVSEVKTYSISQEVLVVQPIVSILPSEECRSSDVDRYNRFSIKKEVGGQFGDQGLVHVRTLNGRALNKFVDFSQGAAQ